MESLTFLLSLFLYINSLLAGFHHSVGLKKSWDDAKLYCEKNRMVMAKLDSENDMNAAIEHINGKTDDVWIGLRIFGENSPYSYKWTDRQRANYLDFHDGVLGFITACNSQRRRKRCIRLGISGGSLGYKYNDYKICNSGCSHNYEVLCMGPLPTTESLNTTDVSMSFKRSFILACSYNSSVPVIKIYWRITKASISNQVNIDVTENEGITVYIHDIFEKEDVGSYQCFVENMAGTAEGDATLVNLMPDTPTAEINQTNLKVFESNRTVLFCMGFGYPNVNSITWTRNSGEIQAAEERFGDVSVLVFDSTLLADEGTYTCSVSNELGSANSTGISMQVFLDETYCECDCEYKEKLIYWSTIEQQAHTKEDLLRLLRPELAKLVKDTMVDVSELSSRKYKRKSRKNVNNQSAESIGIVAVILIVGVFCLALIADLTSWRKHLSTLRKIRLSTR